MTFNLRNCGISVLEDAFSVMRPRRWLQRGTRGYGLSLCLPFIPLVLSVGLFPPSSSSSKHRKYFS